MRQKFVSKKRCETYTNSADNNNCANKTNKANSGYEEAERQSAIMPGDRCGGVLPQD
jgi:hypothetical protein